MHVFINSYYRNQKPKPDTPYMTQAEFPNQKKSTQTKQFFLKTQVLGIPGQGYRNVACPRVKVVPQLLVVFCVSAGSEINCRLWPRPSRDRAISDAENVVVIDDRPLTGFMRDDRAGYRDVARFL